jgi:hypothetical protein
LNIFEYKILNKYLPNEAIFDGAREPYHYFIYPKAAGPPSG